LRDLFVTISGTRDDSIMLSSEAFLVSATGGT